MSNSSFFCQLKELYFLFPLPDSEDILLSSPVPYARQKRTVNQYADKAIIQFTSSQNFLFFRMKAKSRQEVIFSTKIMLSILPR